MNRPAYAGLEAFRAVLEKMRIDAFAVDPGLESAFRKARVFDLDIGWLDVAARREES